MSAPLVLFVLWGCAACGLAVISPQWRQRVGWALALIGVPILGWLTLRHGPLVGAGAFALGLAALYWAPRLRRRRLEHPAE